MEDLGISDDNMLIVSERILRVMSQFHLDNSPYASDLTPRLRGQGGVTEKLPLSVQGRGFA